MGVHLLSMVGRDPTNQSLGYRGKPDDGESGVIFAFAFVGPVRVSRHRNIFHPAESPLSAARCQQNLLRSSSIDMSQNYSDSIVLNNCGYLLGIGMF
jgi:hypothetical protein